VSLTKLPLTGSQTVGPYYAIGLEYLCCNKVPIQPSGEVVRIRGRLLDGDGIGIPDAFLEIWQADSEGRYATGNADGFARIATDADGAFHFETRKPGAVPYDGERMQAPPLLVLVFMRGLLRNLVTRMYFSGEAANAADPVLLLVPPERRPTLTAQQGGPSAQGTYLWDVRVCSNSGTADTETVFFEW
jgi:protocatechuate 3,4-dioxygenase alpha subunit